MNRPSTTLGSYRVARSSIARTSISGHAPLLHPELSVASERELPIPPFGKSWPRRHSRLPIVASSLAWPGHRPSVRPESARDLPLGFADEVGTDCGA